MIEQVRGRRLACAHGPPSATQCHPPFEAAARHLSITLAADELSVTTGAVSRQIKSLEESLGVQLLERGHRQIALTRQGGEYYRAVRVLSMR